jgi:DMSO reductase family type II enzyme heme b subunit
VSARALVLAGVALAAFATVPRGTAAQEAGEGAAEGKEVYDRWCAGCHGVDGAGEGPGAATMLPRPRDFTRAQYQVRTTGSGELPTDEDILHVINVGMPGTAMPGWEDLLTLEQREALVAYVKTFSRFFEGAEAPAVVEFSDAPGVDEERIARGAELYQEIECWQCHGQAGRGDGNSANTLDDDTGFPIYAADLTRNWLFNGGSTVEDIYRRMRTGLDGTPMPTFSDLIDSNIITDDDLWSLAHYVRSLSPEETPEVREVITAALLEEGELPTTTDDPRWAEVEPFLIPLAGQIVQKPRWFSPRVTSLWVRALHDGDEVALMVSWTDPSRSPDGQWAEFAQMVVNTMEPKNEGSTWAPGAADRLVVQFPRELPTGLERPHFMQGDARRPTYLWSWTSAGDRAVEMRAQGLETGTEQPAESQQMSAVSSWTEGEWRVLFRRSLATPDSIADLQLPRSTAVPIAFQAWDGDNGEAGKQAAISTWYFLALEDATPATVYVAPIAAFLLTAVLGMAVVSRAQKKERAGQPPGA